MSQAFHPFSRTVPRAVVFVALSFAAGLAFAQSPEVATANPYGLQSVWESSDVVAKGTLAILAIMSLGSWYVILGKLFEQWRIARHARASAGIFGASGVDQGVAALKSNSPFRYIAETGIESIPKHVAVGAHIDFNNWLALSIQQPIDLIQNRLQGGLAFLATVGSTAPFVGLFGTVWGIYHALTAIGVSGQASIDKVAGPVGEALIMTAIGLAVAVPAVLGYNWLVRRNKVALDDIRSFGSSLHSALLASPAAAGATR